MLASGETGGGSDQLLSRLLVLSESGPNSDACITLQSALARVETGSGLDAFADLMTAIATAEAGSSIDELLLREMFRFDAASGLDIATLYKVFSAIDSGAGLETLASLLALIITSEAGSGSEQLRAKIAASPGADDMRLPTGVGESVIPATEVKL